MCVCVCVRACRDNILSLVRACVHPMPKKKASKGGTALHTFYKSALRAFAALAAVSDRTSTAPQSS